MSDDDVTRPPDDAHEGDAAEQEPPPPARCEVCGADLEPDQTYCLECGSPTPAAPRLGRGGRGVAVLAGAMAVLGLGAGAFAYAVVNDDGGGGASGSTPVTAITGIPGPSTSVSPPFPSTPTGTLPPDTTFTIPTDTGTSTGFPTVTGGSTTPTDPSTDTSTDDVTDTSTDDFTDTSTDDASDGTSDWPSGTTAWTAILRSAGDESTARQFADKATDAGEDAGVLRSSDYPGLRPGYWVAYAGQFDTRAEAEALAQSLSGEFPGAYARRIEG
ncbi:MAG: SPOR domain-containing protein [Thermoleophilia bacterium]